MLQGPSCSHCPCSTASGATRVAFKPPMTEHCGGLVGALGPACLPWGSAPPLQQAGKPRPCQGALHHLSSKRASL